MRSKTAASPPLKRKNLTPASRGTNSSVNAMPTPRCARKKKRTVERDIGQDGFDGQEGQDGREGPSRPFLSVPPILPFLLACPENHPSRLLISAQLTTFHQASR